MPSEMSRMLPGRPLCPYGIFSGSTSMVLPLGRNVTLNFFVAGLYLTSSIYGLLPPMNYPPSNSAGDMLNAQLLNGVANWGAALLLPYEENLDFGQLAAFERRRDGARRPQAGRSLDFLRRGAAALRPNWQHR